jgi:thiosulfate dehydrogenase
MRPQIASISRTVCAFLLSLSAAACSSAAESDVERGNTLFETPAASSQYAFSCSTCHDASAVAAVAPLRPGAPLAGVADRPTFWGGQENDLLESINDCSRLFMEQKEPLTSDDANAAALYAYLRSLAPGNTSAFAFSLLGAISDVPRGDADAGQRVFTRACVQCHGIMHEGTGRLSAGIPILPEDTLTDHAEFDVETQRLIFIEKIRHGVFYGYGGEMPPFSRELMTDQDVSDLLEALGVLGQ